MKKLFLAIGALSLMLLTGCFEKTCTSCNGSGEQTCITCSGSGEILDYNSVQPCNKCGKTGLIDGETCTTCLGTGKQIVYECVTCHHTGKTPCKGCDGTGVIKSWNK